MAAHNRLTIPEQLLAQIHAAAQAEGKSPEQWLAEAVQARLDEREWCDLLEYGRERGRASGYREEDVPGLVKDWRREQRER